MVKRISKFLSALLVICMVISIFPAAVFAATPEVLYLQPNSNWLQASARFAAYFYGNGETWVDCTDSDGDGVYEVTVPSGYTSVIFCRMDPSTSTNSWDSKWNQTSDLTIPTDGTNCYTVEDGTWDAGNGSWSTYSAAAAVEYYLVGYINGANYGCEEDYENMGEYKFVDDRLVVTFQQDSYVFLKTTGNASWYMAESYCTDTTCTMVTGGSEKLYVPGGVEVHFSMIVNDSNSVILSYYTASTECSHSYTSELTTAPTCTTSGLTTYTCTLCGDQYRIVEGATGHSYSSKVTTAATCITAGVMTYTCANCGDSYTEVIPATGHSYSDGICTVCGISDPNCDHSYTSQVTIAATCTEEGVMTYTCSKCGDVYTEAIAATGHDYVDEVVAPTCENNGYTRHRCVNCGNYTFNTDAVNPLGHDETAVVTAPTCTEEGYTTYTCSRCGQVRVWNTTAATGHTYVAGTCTTCGAADEDYVLNYYLVGYINGANYGCEEDYENMGEYVFVDGKLKATFTADSYVYVKITNNDIWYMAQSFTTEKTVTLYNTTTGSAEKLYVPGNVQLEFTLVDNGNGSLTLSYAIDAENCTHPGHSVTGECTTCGLRVGHTYVDGACSVCGLADGCTHTEHDVNGYCFNCGAAVEHTYVSGVCSVCGASDPTYVEEEWYLFGYINGTNYGEYDDAASTGYFRLYPTGDLNTFGKTFSVTSDSYIAVKNGSNTKWYMTDGWQGTEVTSVTLYDTTVLGEDADKLYIPTGTVTVKLVVNTDGTMTLSYTVQQTAVCEHPSHDQNGYCTVCHYTVEHTYVDGVCSVCGLAESGSTECSHSYTSEVTTEAGCLTDGLMTYTCSLCGDSYTEAIPYTGHSFNYGTCTKCGEADPNYSAPTVDYYLVGYINGANYGCEEDYANLGQYKFEDGKLTATFDVDSYVFVKTGDNNNWYLTESYCTDTTGTFVIGGTEKMYVPGGVELTFTLVENADGSVTLSYITAGTTVTVPTITLSYPTLAFEDEILYNAYFTVDDASSIVEMGMITFSSKLTDGTISDAVDVISGYTTSGSNYIVHSNGIPAKNLGDALYFKVYAKLSDGSYAYSDVAGYNAVAYAKTILNSSSSSDAAKALVVAMLNYGAAAQTYFGYNTSSLMNASLTAAQLALVGDYSESMVASVVTCTKSGSFVNNGGYSTIYPTVSFESAFAINYYFATNYTPDSAPTFYYWDAATYASVSELTAANATGTITMTLDGDQWYGTVSGIAAKEIDQTYYTAGIYTSGGTTYTSPVISYSLGKYCQTVAANGEAFGAATAVYGYYAKAYFA